ncbi:toprim domain-containing protein [Kitasatospora sp. MBT66]|uniref:toprim domain-containing protein n=1 Tax=Kitasatospora sp. MBT66 TaxID=1444769 RepID=UPI001E51107C|nr:toprim domain-containing protein [Kitasatospora sp. MBT66]
MEKSTARYAKAVAKSAAAGRFLEKRFGPRAQDSARLFRLGVVADPLPGHEQYAGMLSIPYETPYGVVGLKFRCLQEHDCKTVHKNRYLNPPGHEHRLFNVADLFRPLPYIALSEGEIDAITSSMARIPTVGAPGATSWKPAFTRLFLGYETVYILTDNDDDGTGLEKFASPLAEKIPGARIILMPKGQDVNSFVMENGYDALRELVGV